MPLTLPPDFDSSPLTGEEVDAIRALCGGIDVKLAPTQEEGIDEALFAVKEDVREILISRKNHIKMKKRSLEEFRKSPASLKNLSYDALFRSRLDKAMRQRALEKERHETRQKLCELKTTIAEVESQIDALGDDEKVEVDPEEVQAMIDSLTSRGRKRPAEDGGALQELTSNDGTSENDQGLATATNKKPRI